MLDYGESTFGSRLASNDEFVLFVSCIEEPVVWFWTAVRNHTCYFIHSAVDCGMAASIVCYQLMAAEGEKKRKKNMTL